MPFKNTYMNFSKKTISIPVDTSLSVCLDNQVLASLLRYLQSNTRYCQSRFRRGCQGAKKSVCSERTTTRSSMGMEITRVQKTVILEILRLDFDQSSYSLHYIVLVDAG